MSRKGLSTLGPNRVYMRRVRSLNIQMVLFVFFVMMSAGLLTVTCSLLLYKTGVFRVSVLASVVPQLSALLVSCVIGTSITAVASEKVLKPLNQLIKATKIISTGNFRVRVEETNSNSEIGELLRNFNHMAEELGSIEMFRNDFINNFSHEFKTPIVSIRGFARQLRNENLPPEKRKEYTDIIISESERLANMSANVLLLTKYENQQIITDKAEYELDEQIRNCVILFEKQWSGKNIEIDLDLEPVKIFNNAEMLSHLWINLIENAVKYANENGHISVACRKTPRGVGFVISDDGGGMDAYTIKHIFDKFYQGDRSHTAQGNGLGLSIVKRIVELCEGEIAVNSKPGQGTAFTVLLP